MGNLREIKSRIKTVGNTAKITRTMELIATAKSQVCVKRIKGALPYFHALGEIATQAQRAGGDDESGGQHPLLEQRSEIKRVALLIVVANRGFCGGYNGNVLRMARRRRQELLDQGKQVDVYISGKKGINWLRFQKLPYAASYTQFEDRPAYAEVEAVADTLIASFLSGDVDRVEVAYTHYLSAARQEARTETLLPIESAEGKDSKDEGKGQTAKGFDAKGGAENVDFIIEPDPASILDTLFPLQAKLQLFRVYLEAATSEQIARRIAMKNATENASEMGQTLKMAYNRARQTQITNEILEVIGGAEALQ